MEKTVLLVGNTYPHKARIKALGGRWNADARGWDVPESVAGELAALVGADEPRRASSGRRYGSRYTRFSSGAEVFQNERGRCEDAPCCGCCS